MRLAVFIRENLEIILQEWEDFAVTLSPLGNANKLQLRDHAKAMLLVICTDLDTFQADQQSIDKSRGNAPELSQDTAAESHAAQRMGSGFSVEELMAEYRALRASVLRLWQARVQQADVHDLQDMTRFNEAIDQSLTESIARYSELLRDSQNVFLSILGHDVRNPLGAISMGSQLLLHDTALEAKHVRVAQQIRRSVDRVNGIVSDLLDFSTTHLGRGIPVTMAAMDFRGECSAIVDELKTFYPTREIRLTLEGDLNVFWDRGRIGQALSNLIANAVHHGAPGTVIWVSVSASGDNIDWSIQNEGKVISPEEMRFMFDPGRRFGIKLAESGGALPDGHLGLGLYVTRVIVEAHQGIIRVSSTTAEGTTFTVSLPRGQAPA
jgi:signal transduction histidine kinase